MHDVTPVVYPSTAETVALLLNKTDDKKLINATNNDNRSTLHIAAITNNVRLCKLLVAKGAKNNTTMKHKVSRQGRQEQHRYETQGQLLRVPSTTPLWNTRSVARGAKNNTIMKHKVSESYSFYASSFTMYATLYMYV